MAKQVARIASFGIEDSAGACQALTGRFNNVTLSWTAEAPEATGFGETTVQRLSGGIQDWEFSGDVWYDAAANQVDVVFAGIGAGGATRFIGGPSGSSSGCNAYSGCGVLTNYEMKFGVADAAQASFTIAARSGSLTRSTFG